MTGDVPDDLLTPWHWLVIPEGTSKSRFVDENRAAYFVFTRDGATWESALSTLIEQGATDDEIWSGGWRDLLSIPVRRYLEALLGRLRPPAHGVAPAATAARLPLGRPRLTDDSVRADLDRAMANLAADRGITRPTLEQLAGAHDDWEGMTRGGMDKRRKRHPKPFRERVPHLMTE